MAVALSPIGNGFQFLTAGGLPLSGGLLWTYLAGTSTPATTYTSNAGVAQNTNPIVLGADGRPPAEIWLTVAQSYKFVLLDSLSNPIGPPLDNIQGINDINNLTVNGNLSVLGNTTLGDAPADLLTINANAVAWPNNPTHSGVHSFSGLPAFSVGATFGNTARAGATVFDWCEKTTFSPTVTFGGASTGITYAVQNGRFTRHGNLVHVRFQILLSSKGSATGTAKIGGLPYAVNGSSPSIQHICLASGMTSAGAGLTYVLAPDAGATTMSVYTYDLLGVSGQFSTNQTAFSNTSLISCGFSYEA